MKRENYYFITILYLSIIITRIYSYYQLTPTYWHHFSIPRVNNLCTVSKAFSVLSNLTLLECNVKCHFETGNVCSSYNYYQDLQVCQMFKDHGIGFEVKSGACFYYQNEEVSVTENSNLALNKTVHANGNCTADGTGLGQASSLTDGLTSGASSCTCIRRGQNEAKWFVVDLERNVEVRSVAVTTSASLATTANFFIVGLAKTFDISDWQAAGTGQYTLCNQFPQTVKSSSLVVLACQKNLEGFQFVALLQNLTSVVSFNVCEIEVYGKYVVM